MAALSFERADFAGRNFASGPYAFLLPTDRTLQPMEFVVSQVLLVDDNPVQLQVREMILRNAGFMVSIATSADSALALLRTATQHFGLVITDHIMPGISGVEFVQRLRVNDDKMPVIVLSGLPDAESEYEGLNVAFRLKPLPPPELIDLVRQTKKAESAA